MPPTAFRFTATRRMPLCRLPEYSTRSASGAGGSPSIGTVPQRELRRLPLWAGRHFPLLTSHLRATRFGAGSAHARGWPPYGSCPHSPHLLCCAGRLHWRGGGKVRALTRFAFGFPTSNITRLPPPTPNRTLGRYLGRYGRQGVTTTSTGHPVSGCTR